MRRFSAERNESDAFKIHLFLALLKLWEQHVVHNAFRRGCNRRWELAGINPAVIRQQMGHTLTVMTARYTGEIPLEQVRTEFSKMFGSKIELLEKTENRWHKPFRIWSGRSDRTHVRSLGSSK